MENTSDSFIPRLLLFCLKSERSVCYSVPDNITHLQKFLLELGRGFSFVARQKRITFDGRHFRIDLVFYNYILKCFVLIDLKIGDLTHQDLGQMQMYVHYYERELMNEGDNPPIGIVLCAAKYCQKRVWTVYGYGVYYPRNSTRTRE